MFEFRSLYSGSTGNCLFVQSENTKILVDAGVSARKITNALASIDTDITDLDAIVVTHEHIDHVQSLGTLSKKYHIPVFANRQTWDAMPIQKEKISDDNQKSYRPFEAFEIGDIKLEAFTIPHDAANPCGFNLYHDNKKISIATDIGHMNKKILEKLEGSDFIMLEANYDPEILKTCSYPYPLKTRILGPNGHLPNEMAGKTISYLLNSGLKQVVLGHLSKENNFPELAYKTVVEQLMKNNFDENAIRIHVANRDCPSDSIQISC